MTFAFVSCVLGMRTVSHAAGFDGGVAPADLRDAPLEVADADPVADVQRAVHLHGHAAHDVARACPGG